MTRKIQPPSIRPTNGKSHLFDRWARAIVQSKLGQLKEGGLVVDDRGRQQLGQAFAAGASVPRITVSDPAGYRQSLLRGTIGAAESYILGHWDTDVDFGK